MQIDKASRVSNYLILAGALFSLLPFVLLCLYIHPHYDDIYFYNELQGRSLFQETVFWYNNWSGRFITVFIASVLALGLPHLFLYKCYPLVLMLLIFLTSKTLLSSILGKKNVLIPSLLLMVLYLYAMPEVTSGFYYVTCAYVSTLGTLALLLIMSLLYRILSSESQKEKRLHTGLGILLSIFIGGSYETDMAMSLSFLFFVVLHLMTKKDKNLKYILFVFSVLLITTVFSIIAPGNRLRHHTAPADHTLFQIAFLSLSYTYKTLLEILQSPIIIVSLLLFIKVAVQLYKTSPTIKNYLSINPLLFMFAIVAIGAAAFLPSAWADDFPSRVCNQVYLFSIVLLFGLIQVLVNFFLNKRLELEVSNSFQLALKACILICLLPSLYNKNITRAYSDLLTKARTYDTKMHERYATIENAKKNEITHLDIKPLFEDYKAYPLTIYYNLQELSPDQTNGPNEILEKYWGIDTITMKDQKANLILDMTRNN